MPTKQQKIFAFTFYLIFRVANPQPNRRKQASFPKNVFSKNKVNIIITIQTQFKYLKAKNNENPQK